jgi:hypothetical protein
MEHGRFAPIIVLVTRSYPDKNQRANFEFEMKKFSDQQNFKLINYDDVIMVTRSIKRLDVFELFRFGSS